MAAPSPEMPRTQPMRPSTSRDAITSEHSSSSLTASAFAPGLLNTTMPRSVQSGMGMLLYPAPARPMAISSGLNS